LGLTGIVVKRQSEAVLNPVVAPCAVGCVGVTSSGALNDWLASQIKRIQSVGKKLTSLEFSDNEHLNYQLAGLATESLGLLLLRDHIPCYW